MVLVGGWCVGELAGGARKLRARGCAVVGLLEVSEVRGDWYLRSL